MNCRQPDMMATGASWLQEATESCCSVFAESIMMRSLDVHSAGRTMMRVFRISLSMRGRTPGRADGGQYATPLAAMCSLHAGGHYQTGA